MLFCEYGTGNAWNLMLNLSDLLILMELKGFVIRHFCLDLSHSENTSFCENNGSLQFVQQLACYCHVPGYCAVFDVAVFYLQLTVLYWLMLAFCLCVSSIMYDHMHNMPTESTIVFVMLLKHTVLWKEACGGWLKIKLTAPTTIRRQPLYS